MDQRRQACLCLGRQGDDLNSYLARIAERLSAEAQAGQNAIRNDYGFTAIILTCLCLGRQAAVVMAIIAPVCRGTGRLVVSST